MGNALLGAISCGRCGARLPTLGHYCDRCGVVCIAALAPGSSHGMLGGVVPASVSLRLWSLSLDAVPAVVLVALAVGGALTGHGAVAVLLALLLAAFLVLQVALFTTFGRSVGRLLLGLRTVDSLTGLPPTTVRAAASVLVVTPQAAGATVTTNLRRGRDPLAPALPPLGADQLGHNVRPSHSTAHTGGLEAVSIDAAGPATVMPEVAREPVAQHPLDAPATLAAPAAPAAPAVPARAVQPADDGYAPKPPEVAMVSIVLDNDQTLQVASSLLMGRRPANRADGAQHPLFAWADLSRTLSKTHALLTWSGSLLWVTDLGSANGTTLVTPSGERMRLVAGTPTAAASGCTVELGDRTFGVRVPETTNAETMERRSAGVF
ncbi:FHA domain-containing protein [Cryobacterium sp. TMT1-3]|uniref:FHA domain-containing protein n=1 Tax=Cryobacterium sp. TMT1-3 TaxID=1259237 RepID=UPI00106B8F1F|nr:FHA domain-containing protein [Cryobacterium sp. TMT1-3]TFC24433.1 FHA domain-containing protein [Cryobacterium sp. TMT1-3]